MDTTFLYTENSKTFDPHRLLRNLSDKIHPNALHFSKALTDHFLILKYGLLIKILDQ